MFPSRVHLAWMVMNKLQEVQEPVPAHNPFGGGHTPQVQDGRKLSKDEAELMNVSIETMKRYILGEIDDAPTQEQQQHGTYCGCPACITRRRGYGGGGTPFQFFPFNPFGG